MLGAGGAALAVVSALRDAGGVVAVSSRRDADWPPPTDDADVVVNCTPLKEELVVTLRPELQVVDLAYLADGRDTALVAEAKRVGCTVVVDGLDVLLHQGAAAFALWTGVDAPVAEMRDALRRSS